MLNGYLYTGPLPLGSVVAHNCGAAGLFSDKVHPDVILESHEVDGLYTLPLVRRFRLLKALFPLWDDVK